MSSQFKVLNAKFILPDPPESRTRNLAATAASRLGLNAVAPGSSAVAFLLSSSMSHDSSRGYRCCIGRSMWDRPVRSLAPRTAPSFPSIRRSTIPSGQLFLFRSEDLIITTSPTAREHFLSPCLRRWRSRNARKYSAVHRLHIAFLVFCRSLARFRKSLSSCW